MAAKRSIMSDNLKMEVAKELGVYEQVKKDGNFGNVSAKNCGSMVAKAIEIANRSVEQISDFLYNRKVELSYYITSAAR